ncbi:cyclic GMP-AMP synthase [Spea bombifrons]|uniref:cyclic GMP-AMP synthase n=1 Tax=Spea bombifrons TaxID=233779 RepID=UPI002348FAEC|nr:cyclic GMP-AMP synthase [Spea bombifrons]
MASNRRNSVRRKGKGKEDCGQAPKKDGLKNMKLIVMPEDTMNGHISLSTVVNRLKLKRGDISDAVRKVNSTVDTILKSDAIATHPLFHRMEDIGSGSYYEHLKIIKPNEFDIMLTLSVGRLQLKSYGESGAFYTLSFKRLPAARHPLKKYLDDEGNISAQKIMCDLRCIIKDIIKKLDIPVTIARKKRYSPAITLIFPNEPDSISVDLVLALKPQGSWPASTKGGLDIKNWLGTKVRRELRWKPFYLVAKQPIGEKNAKVETWRLSFSTIEKEIIKNHGQRKTCCENKEDTCCRKSCLKLLKCLLELLKENHKRLHQFCSYHAKTAFLHCCTKYPRDTQWNVKDLEICFDRLVDYFLNCLESAYLPNFFIPSYNHFGSEFIGGSLAFLNSKLVSEKTQGYPVFNSLFKL